jgi:small subunit ribosomal protein S7
MSRKILIKKKFPNSDYKFNHFLISILINRILKKGKKSIAKKVMYNTLNLIHLKTKLNPILVLEKAIKNSRPCIELKNTFILKNVYQLPSFLTNYKSTHVAISWIIFFSKKRSENFFFLRLANEILDAAKGIGKTIKKKEEQHKIVESNKGYLQID